MTATTINVKREAANEIIRSQNGKFFTAYFVGKTDGNMHNVNGRTGVYKYARGNGINNAFGKPDLVNAFNVKKMAYRNINLDGIVEIRASKTIYKFS